MPEWLGTAIVLAVVGAIIGAILFCRIRAHKQGKSGCGCGCEHCTMDCASRQSEALKKED